MVASAISWDRQHLDTTFYYLLGPISLKLQAPSVIHQRAASLWHLLPQKKLPGMVDCGGDEARINILAKVSLAQGALREDCLPREEKRILVDYIHQSENSRQITYGTTEGGVRIVYNGTEQIFCEIDIAAYSALSVDELFGLLLEPAIENVLRRSGFLNLHGSCVLLNDTALLFLGPSGAGKTSAALLLARAGHRVLADDRFLLQGPVVGKTAVTAYRREEPHLSLTAECRQMFDVRETTAYIKGGREKFYLSLDRHLAPSQAPVSAIFFPRVEAKSQTEILVIGKSAALGRLMESQKEGYLQRLLERESARGMFETVAKTVQCLNCFELVLGNDAAQKLPAFLASIDAD